MSFCQISVVRNASHSAAVAAPIGMRQCRHAEAQLRQLFVALSVVIAIGARRRHYGWHSGPRIFGKSSSPPS